MSFAVSIEEEGEEEEESLVGSFRPAATTDNEGKSVAAHQDGVTASSDAIHPLAGGESRIPMPVLSLDSLSSLPPPSSSSVRPPPPARAPSHMESGVGVAAAAARGDGPSPELPPSMFNLLGVLNNYRMRVRCHTMDHLFDKINIDARTWALLTRSQMPSTDLAQGMDQLLDTVTEFVKRLNRKSSSCVPTILDNVLYTEEVNFAYRVYSRSNTLFGQLFRFLKPLFAELETYMEERGHLPTIPIKKIYNDIKGDINEIYFRMNTAPSATPPSTDTATSPSAASSQTAAAGSMSPPHSNRSSVTHSKRTSMNASEKGGSHRTRVGTAKRGSLREEARKKAAIASALATAAALAAKAESAEPAPDTDTATTTNSTVALDDTSKSFRPSAASVDPPGAIPVTPAASAQTTSSSIPLVHPSHSLPLVGPTTTAAPSAADLAAQAMQAAADAAAAAELALADDADDSEEEDASSSGLAAAEDMFSKLVIAAQSHQYPLPPRLRRRAVSKPHPELLASYMSHHAKSFHLLESLLDCYLLCTMCALVALALTETLQKRDLYADIMSEVNTLASHFVRLGLPLIDRLLSVESTFLAENMMQLSFDGIGRGVAYSDARQSVRKCRLLHALFAALDIFVFPRQVAAHRHGTKCIAASHIPREELVLTAGYDQSLRIWDLRRNKCLAQFIGHTSIVTWCAFAQSDAWIASASFDGTARIWNARTGECTRVLEGHTDAILDADLGDKDKYLVTGGMDCQVRLWTVATGKCARVYTGHRHWVKSVRFASDGQLLLSAGLDKRIFVWSLRSVVGGGPRHTLTHAKYVLDLLVLSPDRFLSTGHDRTLRVWDPRTGKQEMQLANPADSTAITLALSPDGGLVAAGFFDNTINVYDAYQECAIKRQIKVHNDGILCVRFIDNRTIVVGTASGAVQVIHI